MRLIDADDLRQVLEVFSEKDSLGHTPVQLCDAMPTIDAVEKRIDGLQKLVDINTKRCEELRKQLRDAHESYEKHINELEAQLHTIDAVEVVRCKDCKYCYAEGFVNVRNVCEKHYDFGNVDDDWFCADGERRQE